MGAEYRVLVLLDGEPVQVPAGRCHVLLGPDTSLDAATALDGRCRTEVHRSLQTLARMHLATERVPGRYTSHDLLRAYSCSLAEADPATERLASVAVTLENLADAHILAGRPGEAMSVLKEALLIRENQGNEAATTRLRARVAGLS